MYKRQIKYDPSRHGNLKARLNGLIAEVSDLNARAGQLPARIRDKRRLIDELSRRIREIEEARRTVERDEKALENLAVLLNALDDVQIAVRRDFVDVINSVLDDVWSRLYPYGDYSGVRVKIEGEGRKAGDYVLQLRESGGWVNVDGVASGGERTLAALALRIAFARSLTNIGILLLDEPTHNLDSNGIERLTEVLAEGIPEVLDQVLLITHDDEMEKAATGRAYRLVRNKGADEPTRVKGI